MEILPDVHRIASEFENRRIACHLLLSEQALLIDAGFPWTPSETILPYLEEIGVPVSRVRWLILTHASSDHCGGAHALKERAPELLTVAHRLDADSITSHLRFIVEQIDVLRDFGFDYPEVRPDDPQFLALHGPENSVDRVVGDGARIRLGPGHYVTLYHTPGHTPGHLAVYDEARDVLISGDAVIGDGIPDLDQNLVMPPHYFKVDWYLQSIAKIQALKPQWILATHYQPMSSKDAMNFLNDSESFVRRCGLAIGEELRARDEPVSLSDIVNHLRKRLGISDAGYQYALLVRAHLMDLMKSGHVAKIHGCRLWEWVS
jgi:glyoxylase-like metal-dependent hydrolase (beta-lactamase superfamily II)